MKATNEALLAKQVWRLIKEPDLLVSRVFKGRYFPDQPFFQAKQKGKDSWLWKGWLRTKDLIRKGRTWKVGDGRNIRIWDDHWIPSAIDSQLLLQCLDACVFNYVSELIDHQRLV